MATEAQIMEIIVHGGDARSSCLKAIRCARKGEFREAEELLKKADESLGRAHNVQTSLIQAEIRGEKNGISLLMIHAQDHLMNAMTVKDLAVELIEECKKVNGIEKILKGIVAHD